MKKLIFTSLLLLVLPFLASCYPPNTVVVFGDSLVVNSTQALQTHSNVIVNAYGGTTVCDWKVRMKDSADNAPKAVVASFVGNSSPGDPSTCRGIGPDDSFYWTSLTLNVLDVSNYFASKHVNLYWAAYPVSSGNPFFKIGSWDRVQAIYKYAANQHPQYVHWFDAGLTVAPNHVYTETINGRAVRQPDGMHLTPYGGELYARELLKLTI